MNEVGDADDDANDAHEVAAMMTRLVLTILLLRSMSKTMMNHSSDSTSVDADDDDKYDGKITHVRRPPELNSAAQQKQPF